MIPALIQFLHAQAQSLAKSKQTNGRSKTRVNRQSSTPAIVEVMEPRAMLASTWTGGGDGVSWNDNLNWEGGALPTAADDAVISAGTGTQITVTGPQFANSIISNRSIVVTAGSSLTVNGDIDITLGVLDIAATARVETPGTIDAVGGINLKGTLKDASVTSATTTFGQGGTLEDVFLSGNLDLTQGATDSVTILGGLFLAGTMSVGNAAGTTIGTVKFGDLTHASGSLTGTGKVLFGGNVANKILNDSGLTGNNAKFTIGSNITVEGKAGSISNSAFNDANQSIVNQGKINAAVVGGSITVGDSASGLNKFTNQGEINLSSGAFNLYGDLTLASLGTINRTGGTFNLGGTLNLAGGTLSLTATTGSWNLLGGTIKNGTLNESGAAKLVMTNSGGTLNGMIVNGDLDLAQDPLGALLTVVGGLQLNGSMFLGNIAATTYGQVTFGGAGIAAGALTGSAKVVFGGSALNAVFNGSDQSGASGTFTIGASVIVEGRSGSIANSVLLHNGSSIVNLGTINVTVANAAISVGGGNNSLNVFTNSGTINVSDGALNLFGDLTLARLGTINRTGGIINFGGVLNLLASTLNLNATTGSWNLFGGTIKNGTLTLTGGAKLFGTFNGGTLDGMTVNGALDLSQEVLGAKLTILNGLVLNGTMAIGDVAGTTFAKVFFGAASLAAGSLTGTAVVTFGGSVDNAILNNSDQSGAAGTFTIGPNITIQGKNGTIANNTLNNNDTSIVNQGVINVAVAGGKINVGGGNNSLNVFTNTGTISVSNGTLGLFGDLTVARLGTFNRTGGIIDFGGVLDLLAGTFALNASRGSWNLRGGTIKNGTVNESGGAKLIMTNAGGTLDGLTVSGELDLTQDALGATLRVLGGLVLNGTMSIGNVAGTTFGTVFFGGPGFFSGDLTGTATVTFGGSSKNGLFNDSSANAPGGTFTIGANIIINGKSGTIANSSPANNGSSITNAGTITVSVAGGTINVGGGNNSLNVFVNNGTINLSNGTFGLFGLLNPGTLGTINRTGGTFNLHGVLDLLTNTFALNATTGSWNLKGGTIKNGTLTTTGGVKLFMTNAGGTLEGMTVTGDLDLTQETNGAFLKIFGGLDLTGTMAIGNVAGSTFGVVEFGKLDTDAGGLTGTATVTFGGSHNNAIFNKSALAGANGTFTIGANVVINAKNGQIANNSGSANSSIVNLGTINANVAGGVFNIGGGFNNGNAFNNQGFLWSQNGANLTVHGIITLSPTSSIKVTATSVLRFIGNFVLPVTDLAQFDVTGWIVMAGGGVAATPTVFEVMSQDLGAVPAGYTNNFQFGVLELSNSTYLKLVNDFDNSLPAADAEAVYVDTVIVPAGSTLDLNGFKLYARTIQISGTVVGGTITQMPDNGNLPFAIPTAGIISVVNEVDEWTFFGSAGQKVTVVVNPGATGTPAPDAPQVNWVKVDLLDSLNNVLATSVNSVSGNVVTLSSVLLNTDGLYKVRISAAPGHTSSTGNYLVSVWDATPNVQSLILDQVRTGTIGAPFASDVWAFSAAAGDQVRFELVALQNVGVTFTLRGPNGVAIFTDIGATSPLLNLTQTGQYTLEVHSATNVLSTYSFIMRLTKFFDIEVDVPVTGVPAVTGEAQMYRLAVEANQTLLLNLQAAAANDHVQVYLRFNSPPTQQAFDRAATGTQINKSLFLNNTTAGTWYILVFINGVPAPSTYSLVVKKTEIDLSNKEIDENQPIGTVVGSVVPTNAVGTFIYSLVNGTGSTDNTSFTIDTNGNLKTAVVFNYEVKSNYSVRVRVTDIAGTFIDKVFAIKVLDVNEAPVIDLIQDVTVSELIPVIIQVIASDEDLPPQTLTYTLDPDSKAIGMSLSSTGLFSWSPTEAHRGVTYTVTITVTDDGKSPPNQSSSVTFKIIVLERNYQVGSEELPENLRVWEYPDGPFNSSAIFSDLDNDGKEEVLVVGGNYTLVAYKYFSSGDPIRVFRTYTQPIGGAQIQATPIVVNVPGVGKVIFAGNATGRVFAWEALTGKQLANWPVSVDIPTGSHPNASLSNAIYSGIAAGDLDGDGLPEILVPSYNGELTAFRLNGTVYWKFNNDAAILGVPVIGDIDRDGLVDVVIGGDSNADSSYDAGGRITVLTHDGHRKWVKQIDQAVRSSPTLADLNEDGYLDIVIGTGYRFSDGGTAIYALDYTGQFIAGWPFFINSTTSTGTGTFPSAAVADLNGDQYLEVIVGDGRGRIWVLDYQGAVKWVKQAFDPQRLVSSPVLADVDGDGTPDVIMAADNVVRAFSGVNGDQIWEHVDSTFEEQYTSSPAVGLMQGNTSWQVAFTGIGSTGAPSNLYVYNLGSSTSTPPWPNFRRDTTGGNAVVRNDYQLTQFITQTYESILQRTPSAGEIDGWLENLRHAPTLTGFIDGILGSAEYRNTLITNWYQDYLNRTPDAAGLAFWQAFLAAGNTVQTAQTFFVASDEAFINAGSSPQQWVTYLYQVLLNRTPSDADRDGWASKLSSGALQRSDIAFGFFFSIEFTQNTVREFYALAEPGGLSVPPVDALFAAAWDLRRGKTQQSVLRDILQTNGDYVQVHQEGLYIRTLYSDVLQRDPSAEETTSWLRLIEQGTSLSVIAASVVRSFEYRTLLVQQLYWQYLGRDSTAEERKFWVDNFGTGLTREAVIKGFLQSTEFMNLAGNTPEGYIALAFQTTLGRTASSADRSFWQFKPDLVNALPNALLHSDEYLRQMLDNYYIAYVGRVPNTPADSSAFFIATTYAGQSQVNFLANGGNPETIEIQLLTSAEYLHRVLTKAVWDGKRWN